MSCSCLFAILAGLPILTGLVSGIIFYYQYLYSPEKCWQVRVLDAASTASRQALAEKTSLRRIGPDHEAAAYSLKEEAFHAHLAGISVNELGTYPGIGDATIAKLRGAGYTNLSILSNARPNVHGLGDKRLADIDVAVRDLSSKARREFDAGTCPQALALPDKQRQLSLTYARRECLARARVQATEEVSASLRDMESAAHEVAFWRWLGPRLQGTYAPPELMDAPLPDIDAAVEDAEARAARAWEARRREATTSGRNIRKERPAAPPAPTITKKAESHSRPAIHARALPAEQVKDMPGDAHLLLMELTIQLGLAAARADGPVTSAERDFIRKQMCQRFGYDRALLNRANGFCAHYESAAIDLDQCLRQIKEKFTAPHRSALVEFARQIIAVSSQGEAAGAMFLNSLTHRLDVPTVATPEPALSVKPPTVPPSIEKENRQPAVVSPTAPARAECLALLEISPSTSLSADLVRRQWNLVSERMALEKAARLGPEFLKMAEAKRAAVLRAAEILLGLMGEKLEVKPPAPAAQDLRYNPDLDDVFGGM